MSPNGVRTLVAVALSLALLAGTADAAVAPPRCWKGKAGCTHTATPHWNLRTFTGSVSVVGTRPNALTCADVQSGAREEIVAGRYTVKFSLDKDLSDSRIGANAQRLPTTSKPLILAFRATSTTHERVRTLTPTGDGQGCTETFRDCDATKNSLVGDQLDVFIRSKRVIQETPGDFIQSHFLECAETPSNVSLLPDDAVEGKFMAEDSTLRAFRHRDTVVTHGRDHQIGDGNTSIAISGKLTYTRTIHACTRYPFTKARCRNARG
jgi:hypothetical protein